MEIVITKPTDKITSSMPRLMALNILVWVIQVTAALRNTRIPPKQ